MNEFLALFSNAGLFAVLLKTTPLLLAALGGAFTHQAGILNISLEGMMLAGAFTTVAVGGATGSVYLGLLAAIVVCVIMAIVFAWITISGRANAIVVGIGMNLLASGLTVFLLNQLYGLSGSLTPGNISGILRIDLGSLGDVPVLAALQGQTILVPIALLAVPVCWWAAYRSRFGFHVRAVGEDEAASLAAGLRPNRVKTASLVISGAACALAGGQLALATLDSFNQGMTAGRGFIAVAALIFAGGRPLAILLVTLIFGLAQAYADQLQIGGAPSPLATMLPYVITVAALVFGVLRTYWRKRAGGRRRDDRPQQSPAPIEEGTHST